MRLYQGGNSGKNRKRGKIITHIYYNIIVQGNKDNNPKGRKEKSEMPVISRFYGIIIKMYFRQAEHNPPHIHVIYGEYLAEIDIRTGEMLVGDLPRRALKMVEEWTEKNRDALLEIWKTQNFVELPPLE